VTEGPFVAQGIGR